MKESHCKEVETSKMVKAKENVLDVEIQIISSENVQSHQETTIKELTLEERGVIYMRTHRLVRTSSLAYDSKVERSARLRRKAVRQFSTNLDFAGLKELFTKMLDDDATGAESSPRGVDSYYRPGKFEDPTPIVYPTAANGDVSNFKIQPNLIAILLVFKGHEEPYAHLRELFSIVDTYQVNSTTKDGDDDNYNHPNNTQQQNHVYKPRPQQNKNQGQIPSNSQQSNVDQKFDLILSELAKSNQDVNLKFESLSTSVVNLESQMGQLAEEVHKREAGKLPSYLDLNPKHKPGGPKHVNMVTSLRNGKTYNNDIKILSAHDFSHDVKDFVNDDKIIAEGKKADNVKSDSKLINDFPKPPTQNPEATESPKVEEDGVSSTTTPYPAALEKLASVRLAKNGPYFEDMWETFKQVKINLPLIDAIKQIPAYAKF
uniref:Uncharacterized protein n=1 Tax=Tanacetum cinerariifolium TaxID=118510 RepID=A0A699HGF1_TANCI|nr:hypothetical protein [Tanacetum cinerariifolium]